MSNSPEQKNYDALLKQSFLTLKKTQSKLAALERAKKEPIAIIGVGCRFPGGVTNLEQLWALLSGGTDAITEIPGDRWDVDALYDPDPTAPGKISSRWGGFLEQVDHFDAKFFGISQREANTMDPQQRLFLEVAIEALDHAGQTREGLAQSRAGVFVGVTTHDYYQTEFADLTQIDAYATAGVAHCIVANRLSYLLDLRGPSLAIDTACSSSLVAIHLACQSLRNRESDLAVSGGVNLMLSPEVTISCSKWRMLAPDGRCKVFDASADGFVRSEGCGVVVLKRLSDAQAAGDPILAVIRGSAINQDGHTNGLTAPNVLAQQAVIRQALESADVAPTSVTYIEAHGTGTSLGDPIEVEALTSTYGQPRDAGSWCALGSVKANVGHLEAAAGVAGLIKAVLALRHQAIPPQLHFQTLNPNISLAHTPFRIPTELVPWSGDAQPRRASVSSFGFGGTNAHLILEETPTPDEATFDESEPAPDETYLLPLSAQSPAALQALTQAYQELLTGEEAMSAAKLADVCYTASVRRSHHDHRLAVVGSSAAEIAARLQTWQAMDLPPGLSTGHVRPLHPPRVVFVVPGQGAQWIGMARQLLVHEPVFQQAIAACQAACLPFTDWDLVEQLTADPPICRLDEIDVLQPTLFAIAVGLAALWQSWGVQPAAVIGHSMGEVAAAYVAGALTLDDAARIICTRSRLLRQVRGLGAMATVELSLAEASEALTPYTDRLAIAASNSPHSTVIAGDPAALDALLAVLEPRQIFCQRIKVDVASHSPQMDPLCGPLRELLAPVRPQAGSIPIYSTVEEAVLDGATLDADYWVRNLREPVRLAAAVERAAAAGMTCFIELSPHPILLPAIERTLRTTGQSALVVPSLRRGEDERSRLRESLGMLYCHGVAVAWSTLYPRPRRCVALPAYPWQRERCWVTPSHSARTSIRGSAPVSGHPLLGPLVDSAVQPGCYYAERTLSLADLPYLTDHQVQQQPMLPATGYVELALASAQAIWGPGAHVAEQMAFMRLLALDEAEQTRLQVVLEVTGQGSANVQIFSRSVSATPDTPWTLHATGQITPAQTTALPELPPVLAATIQARCPASLPIADFYAQLAAEGLQYGPSFQGLVQVWRQDGEALGEVRWTEAVAADAGRYGLHPALLDTCLHTLRAALPEAVAGGTYVPIEVARLQIRRAPSVGTRLWVHARMVEPPTADIPTGLGHFVIRDDAGHTLIEIQGFRIQRLDGQIQDTRRDLISDWFYNIQWELTEAFQAAVAPSPAPGNARGSWLVFANSGSLGHELAASIEARGETCVTVSRGTSYQALGPGHYQLHPSNVESFKQLLKDAFGKDRPPCRGIIHLWSLETPAALDATLAELEAAQERVCVSVLHLVQALAHIGWRDQPRLWLATRGAQMVGVSSSAVAVAQSPLWGLGRVIIHEYPQLRCTTIDLSPEPPATEAQALLAEIWADTAENQVALRPEGRYVARLVHTDVAAQASGTEPAMLVKAGSQPFRLEIARPGVLDNLTLRATSRQAPGPGEVEIQVCATGLNFLDVLLALGTLPDDAPGASTHGPRLGQECAGRIVAVGEGVEDFQVGQAVVALVQAGFGSYVTTSSKFVMPKPAHLTFEAAASIPVAFLTAYYALHHVARLDKGERILIHSAAGGVGLAAVQVAQWIGAEIFATAGTPEKRELLRAMGVAHVMDSRSLAFVNEVLEQTGGEGVDVVLNSLAGEYIAKSFSLLRDHGRFIEIGKRDYYEDRKLGLKPFLKNLSFALVDLRGMTYQRPEKLNTLFKELMGLFETGALTPIRHRTIPIADVAEAFRSMAQGKHIGKIVVSIDEQAAVPIVPARPAPLHIRADGTYLISGGLGGIGLIVARWLVEQGARHLVLLGRRPPSEAAATTLEELATTGATLAVRQVDVGDPGAMTAVLDEIAATLPPLRGVFHAAAVLDDALLLQLSPARFQQVLAPKLNGAWILHSLTHSAPLDYFVLFSSAAALLGSPAQGNYAAANAFLDALAHARRAQGLPALSINWGPWAEVGLAAAQANRGERLAHQGITSMTPEQGITALARLLQQPRAQVAVLALNARQWRQSYPKVAQAPLFTHLLQAEQAGASTATRAGRFRDQLLAADPGQRLALLETHLCEQISRVLRTASAHLDRHTPLGSIGLDSLMALELRNRLEDSLELSFPVTLIWNYQSIAPLAAHLAEKMHLELTSEDEATDSPLATEEPAKTSLFSPEEDAALAALLGEIQELSEDEIAAKALAALATEGQSSE